MRGDAVAGPPAPARAPPAGAPRSRLAMSRIPRAARLPLLVVLPALLLVVLAVVVLRGGGDPDPREVAERAFGADEPIRSGRADIRARIDTPGVQGVEGPVSARLRGPFSSRGADAVPIFDFDVEATLAAQPVRLGAVSTGSAGFVELQGQPFQLSGELYSQLQASRGRDGAARGEGAAPSLSSLGVDPLRWLRDPRTVGTVQEGGVDAVHVRSGVDVGRLIADLDRLLRRTAALRAQAPEGAAQQEGLTAPQRLALGRAIRGASLDFWAGTDDDLLRRVLIRLDLDATVLGGRGAGTAALDFRVAGLNEPQRVTAPRGALPLAELQQLLQGAAGGTPAPGGEGQEGAEDSGAAPPAGGGTEEQQDYQQCVEQAGADVDALRACVG